MLKDKDYEDYEDKEYATEKIGKGGPFVTIDVSFFPYVAWEKLEVVNLDTENSV